MKNVLTACVLLMIFSTLAIGQGLHISADASYSGLSSGKYATKDIPQYSPLFQLQASASYEFKTWSPKLLTEIGVSYAPTSAHFERIVKPTNFDVLGLEAFVGLNYQFSKRWKIKLHGIYRRNIKAIVDGQDFTDSSIMELNKNQFGARLGLEYQLSDRLSLQTSYTHYFNPLVNDRMFETGNLYNNRMTLGMKFRLFK